MATALPLAAPSFRVLIALTSKERSPAVVVKEDAAFAVSDTAPVTCVRAPVIVVVTRALPMATEVAVEVPKLSAAAPASIVKAPAVVLQVEAAPAVSVIASVPVTENTPSPAEVTIRLPAT